MARQGWALCAALSLTLGCGRTSKDGDETTAPPAVGDQALVPAELQLPGTKRYFAIYATQDPAMFVFETPDAVRRVSLVLGDGQYRSWRSAWSASGTRYAYQLQAPSLDVTNPTPFGIADVERDFAPMPIEHPELQGQSVRDLEWIGDHAVFATVATYSGALDAMGYSGRYLWIDADSGTVTDLGPLPPGFVPDTAPRYWTSPYGVAFVDGDCRVVYGESPGTQPTSVKDCQAQGSWSGDGSFLQLASDGERQLYRRQNRVIEPVAEPWASFAAPTGSTWNWAPHEARFVTFEGGSQSDTPITKLGVGDAERGLYVELTDLPRLHYAQFANDDLLILQDWEGTQYALQVSSVAAGRTELHSLELSQYPGAPPLASRDSSRLYYAQNPFVELQLVDGRPTSSLALHDERMPIEEVKFRFVSGDRVGLLTAVEPASQSPSQLRRYHPYLLELDGAHNVISLDAVNVAIGTDAAGPRTFQSAPHFGGIFYIGEDPQGMFVDWLGFDDIGHKVRLLGGVASTVYGLDFPSSAGSTLP